MKRADSAAQSLECVRDDAYTRRARSQPVATIWLSVTSTDAPCSHLKRKRSPASVARLIAGISNSLVERGFSAGKWITPVAETVGGGGGGKPDLAQAGGKLPAKLPEALQIAKDTWHSMLA